VAGGPEVYGGRGYKQATRAQISKFGCEMARNAIACLQRLVGDKLGRTGHNWPCPANANVTRVVDKLSVPHPRKYRDLDYHRALNIHSIVRGLAVNR
jgi:hypothetical protein